MGWNERALELYARGREKDVPFAKPAGDVVADRAVETLRGFWN